MAIKGGWIMIPILALSIIAVYIFFDRFFAIRKAGKFDEGLLEKIKIPSNGTQMDLFLNDNDQAEAFLFLKKNHINFC